METLREKLERHLTLPEALDALNIDYEDLWDQSLCDLLQEKEDEVIELLSDYGD